MPKFADLGDALSSTLDLPVAGRTYKVPSPPARVGLRIQAVWSAAVSHDAADSDLDYETVEAFRRDVLSDDVYDAMLDDDVPLPWLQHAHQTALIWHCLGEKPAREAWERPMGKALTPETGE